LTEQPLSRHREGKIKHIGLSNVNGEDVRRAHAIAPVTAVQVEYSPFAREIEKPFSGNVLAVCRELGIAVVCYAPMGRGMITADFTDAKAARPSDPKDLRPIALPRFSADNRTKNAELVQGLKAFADRKGCTLPQLSMAWLLAQGDDIFLIPGTKRIKYLEENMGALEIKLSEQEVKDIRNFVEAAEVAGATVPDAHVDRLFVQTVKA
jgi:aryl-alcohol dehydrogenase-like predicted oxidoreductase